MFAVRTGFAFAVALATVFPFDASSARSPDPATSVGRAPDRAASMRPSPDAAVSMWRSPDAAASMTPASQSARLLRPLPSLLPAAADAMGSLVLKDLDGAPVSLAKLRGKVVVLNFWATWCKPCIEEMPLLADLATRYQNRGLVVVAASVDEATNRDDVARVAAALPAGMEVWIGATQDDMQRLHLGDALPATAILNRRGELEHRQRGPITPGLVDDKIESLLGEGGAPKAFPDATQAALPHAPRVR
jgi:thiol-disulfide isomerase/thioredoxin